MINYLPAFVILKTKQLLASFWEPLNSVTKFFDQVLECKNTGKTCRKTFDAACNHLKGKTYICCNKKQLKLLTNFLGQEFNSWLVFDLTLNHDSPVASFWTNFGKNFELVTMIGQVL